MKELLKMVKEFSNVMDIHTGWKNPTPEHALLFAIGEIGEAIQAWVYEDANGGYSPNSVNETVGQEVVDCFIMCVKAGWEGNVRRVYFAEEDEDREPGVKRCLIESNRMLGSIAVNTYFDGYNYGSEYIRLDGAVGWLIASNLITKDSVTSRLLSIAEKQIGKMGGGRV